MVGMISHIILAKEQGDTPQSEADNKTPCCLSPVADYIPAKKRLRENRPASRRRKYDLHLEYMTLLIHI